jgi:hypothetical protein
LCPASASPTARSASSTRSAISFLGSPAASSGSETFRRTLNQAYSERA